MPLLKSARLSGQELLQFREALKNAFGLDTFDDMLLFQVNRKREHIALGNAFETILLRVLQRAEEESWTAELLQGARASRPNDAALLTFAQQFGLAPATPRGKELERTIKKANSVLDPVQWRTRLGEIETRVCRIEIKAGGVLEFGTGFLLGPDVVMTNYHVMEKVIKGNVLPKRVTLRFDYKKMADGVTLNSGTEYSLAEEDWLLDHSEYSSLDLVSDTGGEDPQADQLDYALLRLSSPAGNDPVGGPANKDPHALPRKWITHSEEPYEFTPHTAIFIMQHPDGEPLKLALDTEAVLGTNGNKTRVRYTTNTEGGSSGSPCFDANWQFIALHHGGDPNYEQFHHPEYNQGIPFSAIFTLLKQRNKESLLDEQP